MQLCVFVVIDRCCSVMYYYAYFLTFLARPRFAPVPLCAQATYSSSGFHSGKPLNLSLICLD